MGAVKKGARANDFEIAIQWLIDAGLVHKVPRIRKAAVPLSFYEDLSAFKLYVLDCGLLGAMSQTKGAFSEKSLHQYIRDNPGLHGLRFSMSPYREQEWVTNIPLYAVKYALPCAK